MRKPLLALLLMLALLLVPATSLVSVGKAVYGNSTTVDFGERLHVRVSVTSDRQIGFERLEDPFPEQFSPINYPPACSAAAGALTCQFGYQATNLSIEYDLVAVGAGQKVSVQPARFRYIDGGLPLTRVSNEIDGLYYVGRALINASLGYSEVDGERTLQPYILPGSTLRLGITFENGGALPASGVAVSVSHPDSLAMTDGPKSATIGSLAAGESQGIVTSFKAPGIANFSEGAFEVNYTARWTEGGKEKTAVLPVLVFLQKPEIEAARAVSLKWRRSGGTIEPVLKIDLTVKNRGSAKALVHLQQGVPGAPESSSIIPSFILEGREERKFSASSVVSGNSVSVPAGALNYSDARGNDYPGFLFPADELKIEKSLWATIYTMTQRYFPLLHIIAAAILIAGLILLPFFGKNVYLAIAISALIAVAAIILASTGIVWFGL